MTTEEIAEALRSTLLHADGDLVGIEEIVSMATPIEVKKGDLIWGQGEYIFAIYVVASGRVVSFFKNNQGKRYVLMTHCPTDIVGLLQFVDGGPCEWGVVAEEDSCLLKIHFNRIREIIKVNTNGVDN